MITVKNISKTYQGYDIDHKESGVVLWAKNAFKLTANKASSVKALSDVSFDVTRGEVFGIYGENGAGKTTLIKILSGLLLPDSGSLHVNGYRNANQIREQISYVSTNGWMGLEWQLTAQENVLLYGNIFGLPYARLRERCDDVLDRFGMLAAKNKAISELSAGMRQKVTLARGFLLEKPILYLDEPSVSLDVPSARSFREMLSQYTAPVSETQNQKTVLISSHNPLDLQICDRILLLHEGCVVAVGSHKELRGSMKGIAVLHITYANDKKQNVADLAYCELQQLDGIHSVISDTNNDNGVKGHLRVLYKQESHTTGKIVDWFISHAIPIQAVQQRDITLQEIYEYSLGYIDAS